jgi:hypothetical protein
MTHYEPNSKRLCKAVDAFADAMKRRLADKEAEGFRGWDNIDPVNILSRAGDKIVGPQTKDGGLGVKDSIDIANFMMMLWFHLPKESRQ